MRKRTTEIFRKPVMVTMAKGKRPTTPMATRMPRKFGAFSSIAEDPRDLHAEAVADPYDLAAADPFSIGHEIDAGRRHVGDLYDSPRRQSANLLQRHRNPAYLEYEGHRQIFEIGILDPGGGGLLRMVHDPLPFRSSERAKPG